MRLLKAMPEIAEPSVTVTAAAVMLGRSTTWVRNRLTTGFLERDPASSSRRILVTGRSLRWARRQMSGEEQTGRASLRLVVDNTGKLK